jgi:biotin carboxyl carrier protein
MDLNKIDELVATLNASHSTEILVRKGQDSVHIVRSAKARAKSAPKAPAAPKPTGEPVREGIESVRSTKVGIFHTEPSSPQIGDNVRVGQVLGVIEAMKIHSEIVSETEGKVLEILVEDGSPVEYGQELYRIDTSKA